MSPFQERADGAPWRNFYGRRRGKALRPGQAEHLEKTLPQLTIPDVGWTDNPERHKIDPAALFGRQAPLVMEVGFGGGEHLITRAQAEPGTDFIGCEPYVNGVATIVPRISQEGITNIRLHPGDARDMLDVLPAGCLSGLYLLYPDPWPKKKHHRRRFVSAQNLGPVSRALAPGAFFRIATDISDYARQCLEEILPHPAFDWTADTAADWRTPWAGWPSTRYEAKALREGRRPIYLDLRRN